MQYRMIVTITPTIHGGYAILLESQDLWTDEIFEARGRQASDRQEARSAVTMHVSDYLLAQELIREAGLP